MVATIWRTTTGSTSINVASTALESASPSAIDFSRPFFFFQLWDTPENIGPISQKAILEVTEEGIVPVDTSGALIMSRCINWPPQHGQKTRNNFLTDHFLVLLGISPPRALLLHPEHLGQRHRRCPPRPRNCDHNAHYSDGDRKIALREVSVLILL